MSMKIIAENILEESHFSSATEQEGEFWGQPELDSDNEGAFRLPSKGIPEDFSYSGTATSDGAGDGTTVIDPVLSAYGDDYFIDGEVTITDFLQDTGDYAETDVPGRLAKTDANTVTITDLDNDEEIWLDIDKGINHFDGDYEFHVDVKCTANAAAGDVCGVWALANIEDTLNDIDVANGDFHTIYWVMAAGNDYLTLRECNNGDLTSDTSIALAIGTQYYLRIVRDESVGANGTLYCYIYSDAAHATLVDTLTVTLTENQNFRYLYWMNSYEPGGGGAAWDGVISNLEIVKSETKVIADFAQSSGTITISAFTYQVNTGTAFMLTVPFSSRDFRIELIASGDAGDATFKWSHDGGATYLGRDDPNQANWLAKVTVVSDITVGTQALLAYLPSTNEVILVYLITGGGDLVAQKSSDWGATWGAQITIAATGGAPRGIAVLECGRILVSYTSELLYSNDNGETWSSISADAAGNLCILSNGNVAMVHGDPIKFRVSTDKGATWSSDIQVNSGGAADIVEAENGDLVCVYQDDDTGDYFIGCRISSDGGATWGSEVEIKSWPLDNYDPAIIKDINGRLYCIWREVNTKTEYSYSDDNGETWSAEALLHESADGHRAPFLCLVAGHILLHSYSRSGVTQAKLLRRGMWEAYSANACPCATEAKEQKLICDAGIVWHGGSGMVADKWDFEAEYYFSMKNLISGSPLKPWRPEQDNISCSIVINLGANVRHQVDAVAFFGCNIRTLSFQMNATDSWGSPSIDESVSFDIATGTIDAVNGNYIQDTSLLADYKDHKLQGKYFRPTSGADSGLTWEIKDNIGNYIILDTAAAHNLAGTDTFAIFQKHISKTFTAGIYQYIRIHITAQETAEGYYQIGEAIIGNATELSLGYETGFKLIRDQNISILTTPKGGIIAIPKGDARNQFQLTWKATEDTRLEILAIMDYLRGKNFVLIPDSTDLKDCSLLKTTGPINQTQRFMDYYDISVKADEVR